MISLSRFIPGTPYHQMTEDTKHSLRNFLPFLFCRHCCATQFPAPEYFRDGLIRGVTCQYAREKPSPHPPSLSFLFIASVPEICFRLLFGRRLVAQFCVPSLPSKKAARSTVVAQELCQMYANSAGVRRARAPVWPPHVRSRTRGLVCRITSASQCERVLLTPPGGLCEKQDCTERYKLFEWLLFSGFFLLKGRQIAIKKVSVHLIPVSQGVPTVLQNNRMSHICSPASSRPFPPW